ncbi:MAG: type IV secretion system DNA-binding domain-containing protein [Chloroflexota bacterium]|nr:type IV secretion system DNA-binding domain-containing protein [Chloroflexota bacterium]
MSGDSGDFFLGKTYDLDAGKMGEDRIHYDPNDLTTHGVITGMTGSGKTGLGVILLEEAALQGIPAIVVDPKGDLTNLLLHFPDLLPEDFKPWVDRDAARREGISVDQAAEKTAKLWKNGLASYGIEKPQLEALRDAVEYAIYTPGSDSGLPVSILASFSAPTIPWEGNKELLRDKISSTVTAVLGLIGIKDIDPVRTKEHILLSNIFEHAWQEGRDLDLATLITHVQSPPFDKLGVFSLDQFYPQDDRFKLAMLLNNFLAAPAFHTWLEGSPLDVGALLFTPDGKPRHSVFYLAHLSDQERMFFVTLLYTAVETWMRSQKGSGSLRVMVYFDEIAGYLPPVSNPPSKNIILRMLKQARAFGVGLVLATQNPVDLDYKALSNAGTWMIGKLQTDQDKARLLDGLEGAAPGINRGDFDRMISKIDKRVFLLHNVHETAPQVFHTRWAMNYLPGPLTRTQLPELNALVSAKTHGGNRREQSVNEKVKEEKKASLGQTVVPVISGSVKVQYYPVNLGPESALKAANTRLAGDIPQPKYLYRPVLAGQARVAYLNRKYNISHEALYTVRMDAYRKKGLVRWENFRTEPIDLNGLSQSPQPNAYFEPLDALGLESGNVVSDLEKDFIEWIYRTQTMPLRINQNLGVVASPEVSDEAFRKMCKDAVEDKKDQEIEAIKTKYEAKLDKLEDKLKKEMLELEEDKQELSHRRMEEAGKGLENIIGLFAGRRRSISTSLTKRRMTSKAKADMDESEQEIAAIEQDMKEMEEDLAEELEKVALQFESMLDQVIEEPVSPYKKNIFIEMFGLLWLPYYAFEQNGAWVTVPAFEWAKEVES